MAKRRQPVWRRDEYKQQQRQQCEAVIAEFNAGDTDVTLDAMAAEIRRYWRVGHVRFHCLRTLLSLWVGQRGANVGSRRALLFYYFVDERPQKSAAARCRRPLQSSD